MNQFWISFAIGVVLSALKAANPKLLEQEKPLLLEIRNDINALFPGE